MAELHVSGPVWTILQLLYKTFKNKGKGLHKNEVYILSLLWPLF
jgi:hypothetical protein